jgi:putative hydrolase of HD superfamily
MHGEFISEIVEFFKLVGKLKKVKRTGWITELKIKNPESVAEHIFGTAMISMIIGDMKKLNTEKLVRMALLHDFAESIMGDWDLEKKKRLGMEKFVQEEKNAIKKIIGTLPKDLRKKYSELFDDMIEKKTKEARLVEEIDKLELFFQTKEYAKNGYDKKSVQKFCDYAKERIKDKDLIEIIKRVEKN